MARARFSIAHVTPVSVGGAGQRGQRPRARASAERALAARAPRADPRAVALAGARARLARDAARRARASRQRPARRAPTAGTPRVIAVGEVLDVAGRLAGAGGDAGAADRRGAHDRGTARAPCALDFVHVHEPFAPSTSNAALRHSRALNVGSFHSSTERLLSTLVARRFVESFFGRLDARTASTAGDRRADGRATSRATTALVRRRRRDAAERARGDLPRAGGAPPRPATATPRCASAWPAAADRRRPAHAHRPLPRLRDAGRGAAGDARANAAWARSR